MEEMANEKASQRYKLVTMSTTNSEKAMLVFKTDTEAVSDRKHRRLATKQIRGYKNTLVLKLKRNEGRKNNESHGLLEKKHPRCLSTH